MLTIRSMTHQSRLKTWLSMLNQHLVRLTAFSNSKHSVIEDMKMFCSSVVHILEMSILLGT